VAEEQSGSHAGGSPSPSLRVSGFTGRPTLTRANRGLQHFYINGRAVRSPLFYRALDDAYRATMPHGRYPAAVLFIDVPPGFVDVNVHPAKTEVRFQDEPAVHGAIFRAVQGALRSEGAYHAAESGVLPEDAPTQSMRVAEPGAPPVREGLPFADNAIGGPVPWSPRPAYGSGRPSGPPASGAYPPAPEPGYRWPAPAERPAPAWNTPHPESEPRDAEEADLFASAPPEEAAVEPARQPEPETAAASPAVEPQDRPAIGALHVLGQARDLFILAEGGGRLWIIDQHVAHERVLFDRMTAPGSAGEPSEPLLIPATLDVDRAQALALDEHRDLLADLGFALEPFGPLRYQLRAIPGSLLGRDYQTVFRDLADELAERSNGGQTRLRKEEVAAAAAGRSCKSAVKAGMRLSTAEMERLLDDLRAARNPYTCPHGRPVFLTLEQADVAALFGEATCE
jgi:DNA mismatch repair protein MutL